MQYSMCYLDVRERVERVEFEARTDCLAVREARAICAEAKRQARAAYAAKGLRVIIRKGYYEPLNVRCETTDSWLR